MGKRGEGDYEAQASSDAISQSQGREVKHGEHSQ